MSSLTDTLRSTLHDAGNNKTAPLAATTPTKVVINNVLCSRSVYQLSVLLSLKIPTEKPSNKDYLFSDRGE